MLKSPIAAIGAVAVAASSPGAAATPVWGGEVWQGEPIVLTSDARAKRLSTIVLAVGVRCKNGHQLWFSRELTTEQSPPGFPPNPSSLTVAKNARGTFEVSYVAAGWRWENESGRMTISVNGILRRGRAMGLITTRATIFSEEDGRTLATCSGPSGQTFFAERRPGAIFGGSTTQEEPFLLRFDARRNKLRDVRFSWSGDCDSGFTFHVGDDLIRNLRVLPTGRFAKTVHSTYDGDDGGSVNFDYDVSGRIGRRQATGTIDPAYTEFDSAGAQADACRPGRLSWSARSG